MSRPILTGRVEVFGIKWFVKTIQIVSVNKKFTTSQKIALIKKLLQKEKLVAIPCLFCISKYFECAAYADSNPNMISRDYCLENYSICMSECDRTLLPPHQFGGGDFGGAGSSGSWGDFLPNWWWGTVPLPQN